MTRCRHCQRDHDPRLLCRGVSRRAFFFFGVAAAVAPFVPVDELDQQVADFLQEVVGPGFQVEPYSGPISRLAQGLIKQAGVGGIQVNGIDLNDKIKTIDLDAIHRQLEAGERNLFGRPISGLKDLEQFEVTLSGFWEGATVGKG